MGGQVSGIPRCSMAEIRVMMADIWAMKEAICSFFPPYLRSQTPLALEINQRNGFFSMLHKHDDDIIQRLYQEIFA